MCVQRKWHQSKMKWTIQVLVCGHRVHAYRWVPHHFVTYIICMLCESLTTNNVQCACGVMCCGLFVCAREHVFCEQNIFNSKNLKPLNEYYEQFHAYITHTLTHTKWNLLIGKLFLASLVHPRIAICHIHISLFVNNNSGLTTPFPANWTAIL